MVVLSILQYFMIALAHKSFTVQTFSRAKPTKFLPLKILSLQTKCKTLNLMLSPQNTHTLLLQCLEIWENPHKTKSSSFWIKDHFFSHVRGFVMDFQGSLNSECNSNLSNQLF